MKKFVFWTGIISVFSGIGFQFIGFSTLMLPTVPPGMLVHLFGLMALFLGIMLILCSRDLPNRGSLVLWEGILRLGGFGLMTGYGLFGDGGMQMALGGVFDLVIGVIYLVWLPKYFGASFLNILLDRSSPVVLSQR